MRVDFTKLYQTPTKIDVAEIEKDRYEFKDINITPEVDEINAFLLSQQTLEYPKRLLRKLNLPVKKNSNLYMSKKMIVKYHKLPSSFFTDKECFVIAMNIVHFIKQSRYLREDDFIKFINQGIDKAQSREQLAYMFLFKGLYYFEQFQNGASDTKYNKQACLNIAKFSFIESLSYGVKSSLVTVTLSMVLAHEKRMDSCIEMLKASRALGHNDFVEELIFRAEVILAKNKLRKQNISIQYEKSAT